MHILKKGHSSTKSLACMTLVCLILEFGDPCWDLYGEGQIHALDRVQKKAAKFAYHINESTWETSSQCRKTSCIRSLSKKFVQWVSGGVECELVAHSSGSLHSTGPS